MRKFLGLLFWIIAGCLVLLVGTWIVFRNRSAFWFSDEGGYLKSVGEIGKATWFQLGFYCHVFASAPVVFIGLLQFSEKLRNRFTPLHRWLGKVYILLVLFLAAPGGIVLATGAAGGFLGKACFMIMSVLWFTFTLMAFQKIKKGDINQHRSFMLRSYVLAFGAISLRLWMYLIGGLLEWRSPEAYALCAYLSWVPNLILAEIWIRTGQKRLEIGH